MSRRWATLLLLLAAAPLFLGGCGASSPVEQATSEIGHADDQVTAANLQAAAAAMEQGRVTSGSYEGVVPGNSSIRVVRAASSSYCLEATSRTGTLHLTGPSGSVAVGGC